MKRSITPLAALIIALVALSTASSAQTSAFSYQGRLTESGNPASGTRMFRFALYDENGAALGTPALQQTLTVTAGVFSTTLDFGAAAFPGPTRTLEISVKTNAADPYVVLNPRQQIVSGPYAVRSLSAQQADASLDSAKLGGVDANQYVTSSSAGNSFVLNSATPQPGANFNIGGNGTVGGSLQAASVKAQTGTGLYGLAHTDGTTTVSTYVGGSTSGAAGGWIGTQSNSPLHLFTNGGQPQLTVLQNGNVGIGTFDPVAKVQVAGNAAQDRSSGGFAKAMVAVNPTGTIVRCYNGVTGSSAGNCGFTVTGSAGTYTVNFGFQVNDRFFSATARGIDAIGGGVTTPISADFRFSTLPNANPNVLTVDTFRPDTGQIVEGFFTLIIY